MDTPDDEVQVVEAPQREDVPSPPPKSPPTFEEVVRAHEPRVRRLAARLLGWPQDVDDVVQEVFLRVLRDGGGFRGDARLSTWLTAVTLNACRSWRRSWKARVGLLERLWGRRIERGDAAEAGDPLVRDETSRRVRDAVRRLGKADREVVVLRHLEELTVPEIATLLGLKVNAVEVRLHRARRRLKGLLAEERP